MPRLNKQSGYWASEGKLAEAFERVERKVDLCLHALLEGEELSEEDRDLIRKELKR